MRYTIPDYLPVFQCTAAKCEATCCAGWQIVIDKKSQKKYRKLKTPFGSRLRNSINWKEASFSQYRKRCAFLNEENLCDIYMEAGQGYLCRTCRVYPRHIEEFEGIREISLSISCPEAARMLLLHSEPVRFLHRDTKKEESYPDFDYFLYSMLADARERMIDLMQNRKQNLAVRMGLCLALAHDLQSRISRNQIFACGEVVERYQKKQAAAYLQDRLEKMERKGIERYQNGKQMFSVLTKLEVLDPDWPSFLTAVWEELYGSGWESHGQVRSEFFVWLVERKSLGLAWDILCEQLMVYFLFTYFCSAVYDQDADAKVRMAAGSTALIGELMIGKWAVNGRSLEFSDAVEVIYRYSRELEHSDQNLNRMEELVKEIPAFGIEELMEQF